MTLNEDDTIHRALALNNQILGIRAEKDALKQHNEQLQEDLREKDEALEEAIERLSTLQSRLEQQQARWDSLYKDLTASEDTVKRLKKQLEDSGTPAQPDRRVQLKRRGSQAELLLEKVVEKTSGYLTTREYVHKIHALEAENSLLKSDYVRLQAQSKESEYLHRKTIEDLMMQHQRLAGATSTDVDSVATSPTASTADCSCLSDDSFSSSFSSLGTVQMQNPPASPVKRSEGLARIQEYKDRRAASKTMKTLVVPISPPRRTTSISRANRLVDHGADDRPESLLPVCPTSPTNIRPPRRLTSYWLGRSEDKPSKQDSSLLWAYKQQQAQQRRAPPRRTLSLGMQPPSPHPDTGYNLHDLAKHPASSPPLFGSRRSQSTVRRGWW